MPRELPRRAVPNRTGATISTTLDAVHSAKDLLSIKARVVNWFDQSARELPWRAPDCTPWGILVSEVMLQQTPVVRVLPVWLQWQQRWRTPADLDADSSGEAVRAWGRLGYPRRALRLHAAAVEIAERFDGVVPGTVDELKSLPGIGDYTAAAVAAFAFGARATVVDTNIRRVHARLFSGRALPAPSLSAAEMRLAEELLPKDRSDSVAWNAAAMELGALICTARSPQCVICPVRADCAWIAAGEPEPDYRPKGQAWAGTDRQLRGAVMAVLRVAEQLVPRDLFFAPPIQLESSAEPDAKNASALDQPMRHLHSLASDPSRLARILEGLLGNGLAQQSAAGLALPA
ncbi:A/G-specific adenine DNA glycosylase [Renibacterium salmoninarum ATCC 33209]|uniref:Adenine DNA glycosylase n=1 Tax=Renibacterium salmoninarum (strain ATCC 33209 / DSM 20767 / JCM 11484 / NBRC 15589 / NCIMB 2235) TaxID=288705 RepID=A9WUM7_RENSM|nr:A/G-specific adenine DNA glycosylase [Renibacterium salmoninarum ATCC 33209]